MASSTAVIQMSDTTRACIERIAAERGTDLGAVLTLAIEGFVQQERARQELREELTASLEDFEETGLHLTGAEVSMWLQSRATGERVPLPTCHR